MRQKSQIRAEKNSDETDTGQRTTTTTEVHDRQTGVKACGAPYAEGSQ